MTTLLDRIRDAAARIRAHRAEAANRAAWHPWWCAREDICTQTSGGGSLHEGRPSRFPGAALDEVAVRALMRDGQPGVSIAAFGPADGTVVDLDVTTAIALARAIWACADQARTTSAGGTS